MKTVSFLDIFIGIVHMKSLATTIASLVLMTNIAWSEPSVRLLSERHRTEWNWIEYRISVTNTTSAPIQNPEVRYFAENTWIQYCDNPQHAAQCASIGNPAEATDSLLKVDVDYASRLTPVHKTVSSAGKVTAVNLKFTGALNPGKTLKVNFRIHKKDWSTWSAANDWSYQKSSGVSEPNYFFAVYDSDGNILWGDDPLTGKTNSDVEVWHDRGGNSVVAKYDGNASEVQKAGRFWMLKDVPMNKKETDLLGQAGVTRLSASAWNGKTLILLKSNSNVKKKKLDSLVYGFYNSFSVDDTTRLKTDIQAGDWIEKVRVCAPLDSCHTEMVPVTSIRMATRCWNDVATNDCRVVVESCGGSEVGIDNHVVISKNTKQTIACLEGKKNVQKLTVLRQGFLNNDVGRQAVNVENLQLTRWGVNFTGFHGNVTDSWLHGCAYTGENIDVGIYDTGIFYNHDGMNEWIKGVKTARRAYLDANEVENGGTHINEDDYFHATHVAGIVGGNGNGNKSPNYMYRGVAPKVKFYSQSMKTNDQRGHVVNHSHSHGLEIKRDGNSFAVPYYDQNVEEPIFENWINNSNDKRPKTYVVAAGNAGNEDGFHSIGFDTKNGIIVGNYAAKTKIPNIHSSMGPTWDGRIKPDLMAPGSGLQHSFDPSNPFVVYLDKISFERSGVTYKTYNLGSNTNIKGGEISNCSIPGSVLSSKEYKDHIKGMKAEQIEEVNKAFCNYVREGYYTSIDFDDYDKTVKITNENPVHVGLYVTWDYRTFQTMRFDVQKDDRIKIRMRLPTEVRAFFPFLKGSIYLADGDDFYFPEPSHKHVDFVWNLGDNGDEYYETSVPWTEDNILSKYLRIAFSYDYGLFSSVPCDRKGGTCYKDAEGTSMAAPYVAGIAALMNQAYMEKIGDNTHTKSLRNSTSKAILIHTADDMIDDVGFARSVQSDVLAATGGKTSVRVTYGKGPDFVTGWGGVNAAKALEMFNFYNSYTEKFDRFREFDVKVGDAKDKRFSVNVENGRERLRLTLAWDDPYGVDPKKRLVNDLDMYLISPTGKYYFPWRLEPLSTECVNSNMQFDGGECLDNKEKITVAEVRRHAVRECDKGNILDESCFDDRNNVEVVDVDYPEKGRWLVVVRTAKVREGVDSKIGKVQTVSIASDLMIEDYDIGCEISHPYVPQSTVVCTYDFGNSLANFVTFSNQTFVDAGDYIQLLDDKNNIIGTYTGSQLAGVRMKVESSMLKVLLDSDNDKSSVGYGFSIDKIEMIPYSMLFGVSH